VKYVGRAWFSVATTNLWHQWLEALNLPAATSYCGCLERSIAFSLIMAGKITSLLFRFSELAQDEAKPLSFHESHVEVVAFSLGFPCLFAKGGYCSRQFQTLAGLNDFHAVLQIV